MSSVNGTIAPASPPVAMTSVSLAELVEQAPQDAVDRAREAVDDARADRVDGALADDGLRRQQVDRRQLRAARRQRRERDLDARHEHAAEEVALGADDVEVHRRAEVHADRRPAEALADRDGVGEPVGADLARVVVAQRHPGLQARADGEHRVAEVALAHREPLRLERRHRRGDDRRADVGEPDAAQLEQVAHRRAELVGGRLGHGREAPVLDEPAVAKRAEVRLGVADVDGEQHGATLSPPRQRQRRPAARGARARAARARPSPGARRRPSASGSANSARAAADWPAPVQLRSMP